MSRPIIFIGNVEPRHRVLATYCTSVQFAPTPEGITNSILIWVDTYDPGMVRDALDRGNIAILDLMTGYGRDHSAMHLFHGLIVNSSYRKRYVLERFQYRGLAEVIYEPWDRSWSSKRSMDDSGVRFGYLDTAVPKWMSLRASPIPCAVVHPNSPFIPFNCHLSVREDRNHRISMAAALGGIVVATPEPVARDLLGEDYPFYISNIVMGENKIRSWLESIKSGTPAWDKARQRMAAVKATTSVESVGRTFLDFCSKVERMVDSRLEFERWREARGNTRVVYTAIFGGFDRAPYIAPEYQEPDVDYVVFSEDVGIGSGGFKAVYIPVRWNFSLDNRDIKIRVMAYLSGYTQSLYIDGGIQIRTRVGPLLDRYLRDHDFAVAWHENRSCIFDEFAVCKIIGLIPDVERAQRRMSAYTAEGFPLQFGLTTNNIIFRRHTPALDTIMSHWLDEVLHVHRDQLCLMYVVWKHGLAILQYEPDATIKDQLDYSRNHAIFRRPVNPKWPAVFR